jgi:succinate dehydrogenase/fumarate reductase cytochrome b subunit
MLTKIAIILFLLAIVYTLISSFWFLVRDKGEGTRTVRRLTWRVGLSLLLFAMLYVAFLAGWLEPGGGNPVNYPPPPADTTSER